MGFYPENDVSFTKDFVVADWSCIELAIKACGTLSNHTSFMLFVEYKFEVEFCKLYCRFDWSFSDLLLTVSDLDFLFGLIKLKS